MIRIDPESQVPLYAQIVEQIKSHIAAGQLASGEQLPTIRQLATDLRINFNTVVRAYRELEREEMISTQRGRGTFVADRPQKAGMAKMRDEKMAHIIGAALEELINLGYSKQEVERTFQQSLAEKYRE